MLDRIEQFRQSFRLRKAEENDTRQDIQRHDPEFHKKKKDKEEHGFKDPYADLTDVSIPALITFLEGLLTDEPTNVAKDSSGRTTDMKRPAMDKAHETATNAYQQRSSATKPTYAAPIEIEDTPNTAVERAAADIADSAIKSTIRDLRALLARNINHIALERGDGFIESIQNAIAKYDPNMLK